MTVNFITKSQAAMTEIAFGLPTKSAKIRALDKAGYKRADIARFLEIRYQHVRNVLVSAEKKETIREQNVAAAKPPDQVWAQVSPDGRVVIPAAYRRLLGIEEGGNVLMMLEDDEVRLISRDTALARVQALVAKYVPDDVSLVDDLLAERRREVEREQRGE